VPDSYLNRKDMVQLGKMDKIIEWAVAQEFEVIVSRNLKDLIYIHASKCFSFKVSYVNSFEYLTVYGWKVKPAGYLVSAKMKNSVTYKDINIYKTPEEVIHIIEFILY
jgi:hypothetical protein